MHVQSTIMYNLIIQKNYEKTPEILKHIIINHYKITGISIKHL